MTPPSSQPVMTRFSCLLLALLPLIHGAAVLDLINLFHQYEDDIIGRGQGVNPQPLEDYDAEVEAGENQRRNYIFS